MASALGIERLGAHQARPNLRVGFRLSGLSRGNELQETLEHRFGLLQRAFGRLIRYHPCWAGRIGAAALITNAGVCLARLLVLGAVGAVVSGLSLLGRLENSINSGLSLGDILDLRTQGGPERHEGLWHLHVRPLPLRGERIHLRVQIGRRRFEELRTYGVDRPALGKAHPSLLHGLGILRRWIVGGLGNRIQEYFEHLIRLLERDLRLLILLHPHWQALRYLLARCLLRRACLPEGFLLLGLPPAVTTYSAHGYSRSSKKHG
mmetsp:Transcript_42149/g.106078  ORF Transcript_42149/g.106078 Transcript_42149/m.106078 type:complete len:263 (+) Transcript_42149:257-1045(+)